MEVDELPAAWLEVDLGGLPEFKDDIDPAVKNYAKQQLLQALFDNRKVIQVSRYQTSTPTLATLHVYTCTPELA